MRTRWIIAIVLFVVAGVVLLRAIDRSPSSRHVEQPVFEVDGLPSYSSVQLLSKPNAGALNDQIIMLRESIGDRALDISIHLAQADLLAIHASEHFRVLVSGDYDAWVAIVERMGSSPRGVFANNGLPFETEEDRRAFKQSWDNATNSMRFARFDPARVMLRWARRDGEAIEHEPPPQALPTSFDGGFQSVVDKQHKNADLIEVIVPVQLTLPQASEKNPLFFAAMTFALPKDTDLALPYSMTLYSVKTIGGSLVLPAF